MCVYSFRVNSAHSKYSVICAHVFRIYIQDDKKFAYKLAVLVFFVEKNE
jgi:hypothetical protein